MKDLRRPNTADLNAWEEACKYLNEKPRKCSYDFPNSDLVHSRKSAVKSMRQYMKENDMELIFYSTGWGWRLRKDWESKIEIMRTALKDGGIMKLKITFVRMLLNYRYKYDSILFS